MIAKVGVTLAVLVIGVVIVVATRPAEFRVTRSTSIAAPPATVFAEVNDFHHWPAWNPWATIDPAMKETYEGAAAGPGAIYTWAGNNQAGAGRMTLVESRPSELIRITLEFLRPFAATNTAEFSFKPADGHTVVTWSMSGEKNFVTKAMGLVVGMDSMIGGQFEKGLARMKSIVEGGR
jgi:polyketide cyclase/dehydrase/lipid transport protein